MLYLAVMLVMTNVNVNIVDTTKTRRHRHNTPGSVMLMQRQNCLCVEEAFGVVTHIGVLLRSDGRKTNVI